MLKILLPTIMMVATPWIVKKKWLWPSSLCQSLMIAFYSLTLFDSPTSSGWALINFSMATDELSTPLLVLSCWLLPLMILASQNHLKTHSFLQQQTYVSAMTILQVFLIMAFSATELLMFYVMFEATLIPTLIIITRWGNQKDRLNAGSYFLFYTLISSLPLLVGLLYLQVSTNTLSIINMTLMPLMNYHSLSSQIWWVACIMAFLVKMPLYGVHLWLPKAHVEAPIAGSMILAAVLLKLGGYGMMRILPILAPLTSSMCYPFIVLALWGVVMTASICMRQTDLKSLIAYSSVSHMSLVAASILTQTPAGLSGALLLMIAHGLTSSALFCLANTNYERTHSRTMILARGLQTILPLMGLWWLVSSLANLALPPLPNLMGELLIMTCLFYWSNWTLIFTGLGTLITTAYSLNMYLSTQRGSASNHTIYIEPSHTREHLLLALHLLPLILLIFHPSLIA